MNCYKILFQLEKVPARSTWARAVRDDAARLVRGVIEEYKIFSLFPANLHSRILRGAPDWSSFSRGAFARVSTFDILHHYFTPSKARLEWARTVQGRSNVDPVELQARALSQAENLIKKIISENGNKMARRDIVAWAAVDISDGELPPGADKFGVVGVSFGRDGMNAALFFDYEVGKFYKITGRTGNLFRLV